MLYLNSIVDQWVVSMIFAKIKKNLFDNTIDYKRVISLISKRNFEDADHQTFGFWVKSGLSCVSFLQLKKHGQFRVINITAGRKIKSARGDFTPASFLGISD